MREREERLIGWKGDTYIPEDGRLNSTAIHGDKRRWIEHVSWKPRVFIYHNFLSDEECNHIRRLAAPQMKRSTVLGADGSSVEDNVRTSYGTFLRRKQDPIITDIEQRLSEWAKIPPIHGEDLQVLRYGLGQKYGEHFDALGRAATILLYLSEVEEGGETAFPDGSAWLTPELGERMGPFSDCAKNHVAFKPKKGDALMFWSMLPDGKGQDEAAKHTGCPVIKGIKWTSTKWLHDVPYRPEDYGALVGPPDDPGLCHDLHPQCKMWAEKGECQKNPGFMLGKGPGYAYCRKSCNQCEDCIAGDTACINRNRERGGYLRLEDIMYD